MPIRNLKVVAGFSRVLFHMTYLNNLLAILKTDSFRLRPVDGTEADKRINNGYSFYLSTSRTRNNSFTSVVGNSSVIIELDGTKLSSRYKGAPVDYWGEDYRKINKNGYEQEDRIFSDKGSIPNASSYIKAVTIFVVPERSSAKTTKDLSKLLMMLKLMQIPYYIYTDEAAFKTNNKLKAAKASDLLKQMPRGEVNQYRSRFDPSQNFLTPLVELIRKPAGQHLSYEAKKLLDRYFQYRPSDAVNQLKNELHNSTSGNDELRALGIKVQEYMARRKLDSKSLVEALREKWGTRICKVT